MAFPYGYYPNDPWAYQQDMPVTDSNIRIDQWQPLDLELYSGYDTDFFHLQNATHSNESNEFAPQPLPEEHVQPRVRKPEHSWDDHKEELRRLYLEEGKTLDEIRASLKATKGFEASAKQFKERFDIWQWRKNLPGDKAQWMVQKARVRKATKGKATAFEYGGKYWSLARAESSANRSKADYVAFDLATPDDIKVITPTAASSLEVPTNGGEALSKAPTTEEQSRGSTTAPVMLPLIWNGLSRHSLRPEFETAQTLAQHGNVDQAEDHFLRAMQGYINLVGPCNDETSKVIYAVADFYAQQDRHHDADKVLHDLGHAISQRWGPYDDHTQQYIEKVAQLMNSWNRETDAAAFLERAEELTRSSDTDRPHDAGDKGIRAPRHEPKVTRSVKDPLDVAYEMVQHGTPDCIAHATNIARRHVRAGDPVVEGVLQALLEQCEREGHATTDLAAHRLRVLSELIRLHQVLDIGEHLFANAGFDEILAKAEAAFQDVLSTYDWYSRGSDTWKVCEACLQLAATCVKCGQVDRGTTMFYEATAKVRELDLGEGRMIWLFTVVGRFFENLGTWEDAQPWFEQALSTALGDSSTDYRNIIKILERCLQNERFSIRDGDTAIQEVIYGSTGMTFRQIKSFLD